MVSSETLEKGVAKSQAERVEANHVSDSLTLLLYLGLLILSLLTIWLFKHMRFRFIHETGLAIIYGLIVGAIIRYSSKPSEISVRTFTLIGGTGTEDNTIGTWLNNASSTTAATVPVDPLPPEKVLLNMLELSNSGNQTRVYEYDYTRRLLNRDVNAPVLNDKATFNPEVFFHVILPPIIFCAGYSMKRKHFFSNIGAILTLAFIGTTISCAVVGSAVYGLTRLSNSMSGSVLFTDCLLFGAIISATDPVTVLAIFNDLNVDVDLYALVFGESVLNDAVAIVLAQSVEKYDSLSAGSGGLQGAAILTSVLSFLGVFFGALAIGSAMGCLTALITKYTLVREHPLLECSLFILMSYSTFLAAEAAGSSGIVAVLFCGICQAHYTYNNLSRQTRHSTKTFFELLNFLAENFTFLYIGVTTFTYSSHVWDPVFLAAAFLAILLGRALNIYPLCGLLNLGRRCQISVNKMHMLMFSGLRGAIAFALAIRNTSTDTRKMLFSTTLVIVIATVLLCGGLATQMLQWLRIRVGADDGANSKPDSGISTGASADFLSLDSYCLVQQSAPDCEGEGEFDGEGETSQRPAEDGACRGEAQHSYQGPLARSWHLLDNRFLKPLLTHARPLLTETCPPACLPLARLLTTDEQLTRASVHRDLISDPMEDERPIMSEPGQSSPALFNGCHANSDLNSGNTDGLATSVGPINGASAPDSVFIEVYDGHFV